jgi:hypothetical protein
MGFLCFFKIGGIKAFFCIVGGEIPILLICFIEIMSKLTISNEIYELNKNISYEIQIIGVENKEHPYGIARHKYTDKCYIFDNEKGYNEWKILKYKKQAINILCFAREYVDEGLFSKEYLPLDIFNIIVKSL